MSPTSILPADAPTSVLGQTPCKRLRSCLSPARFRSLDHAESSTQSSPATSRSASFSSSDCSEWKRTKSVRWEGATEDARSAVTSYFDTWSSTEYDRTPLEPPTEGERACVLPERGSRCLSPMRYLDSATFGDAEACEYEDEQPSSDSISLETPFDSDSEDERDLSDAEAEEQDESDREWEECMERRRMMFAQMRSQASCDEDRAGQFEGYTSLSHTLADLLRSVRCGGPSTPLEEVTEEVEPASFETISNMSRLIVSSSGTEVQHIEVLCTPELSSCGNSEIDSVLASPAAVDLPRIIIEPATQECGKGDRGRTRSISVLSLSSL